MILSLTSNLSPIWEYVWQTYKYVSCIWTLAFCDHICSWHILSSNFIALYWPARQTFTLVIPTLIIKHGHHSHSRSSQQVIKTMFLWVVVTHTHARTHWTPCVTHFWAVSGDNWKVCQLQWDGAFYGILSGFCGSSEHLFTNIFDNNFNFKQCTKHLKRSVQPRLQLKVHLPRKLENA